MGGIYQFTGPVDVDSALTYTHTLQRCIDRHPQLASTVIGAGTKTPEYRFCPRLALHEHIRIFDESTGDDGNKAVERALPGMLNPSLTSSAPAWKILVLPLSVKKCFLALSYSHALGDGMSGMAFHKTFLDALQVQSVETEDAMANSPPFKPIRPPFDTPKNLPISWSFLLSPLLGSLLSSWLVSLLGIQPSINSIPDGTWTGSSMFFRPGKHTSQVVLFSIEPVTVRETLQICRRNQAKMTARAPSNYCRCLIEVAAIYQGVSHLAIRTALTTRPAVGASVEGMGNFVSSELNVYPSKQDDGFDATDIDWSLAKSVTNKHARSANNLQDQPVGLLRYVGDIRGWILTQVGDPRDASCEVSNIVNFEPLNPTPRCSLTKMIFCQPADVLGSTVNFNIVSVANGPMCITVS